MQEMQAWSLDQEDPLEEEMATHTNIFAWKIPWRAEANITVHGVAKSQIWLSDWSHTYILRERRKSFKRIQLYTYCGSHTKMLFSSLLERILYYHIYSKSPILQLFELWTFKDANTYSIHVSVCLISCVQLFVTSWTVTCQALLSKNSPGKNIGESCHFLLQGIFPTQGSNTHFLHCQADSLPLSHLGSPMSGMTEITACPPFPIADNPSALPSPTRFSLPQSVTLLACSLNTSPCRPAVTVYYWTCQGTVP